MKSPETAERLETLGTKLDEVANATIEAIGR
jgi:hypothetical protein